MLVKEYFDSADAEEVARILRELQRPLFGYYLVKCAVRSAMDRTERELELAARLLGHLCDDVLEPSQVRYHHRNLNRMSTGLGSVWVTRDTGHKPGRCPRGSYSCWRRCRTSRWMCQTRPLSLRSFSCAPPSTTSYRTPSSRCAHQALLASSLGQHTLPSLWLAPACDGSSSAKRY